MAEIVKLEEKLKDELTLLKGIVEKELFHQDYKRVTELADLYYKLKTGDEIESLLRKIETRVTDEEFEMIKSIYRSIIPATLNSTKLPFQKAVRKQPLVRVIDFESDAEKKKLELEEYVKKYWGDKSLEEFLEYAFIDYNFIDPNAFLITEFDAFDNNKKKADPYPFIASSAEAIDFKYKNEILQYLVVKLPIKYMDQTTERDGVKFTMYLGYDTIVLSQVAGKFADEEVVEIRGKWYAVYFYQPKNSKVPAQRFGFLRDEQTKGRTFVCLFHAVIGFLEKTLKIDSELDLCCAMTAFPQRYRYVTPCFNPGCNHGKMPDQTLCPVCDGNGVMPIHGGTQDVVLLTIPRDANKENMVDLQKLAYDHIPPIELLTFQKEYLEYLKKSVHAMMFNADLYTRDQVSITATEQNFESDNMNDTLYSFARTYSALWEFVVKDIATFTDFGDIIVQHKFPNDFKFKGLLELMTELKMAKDAGASTSTIAAIEDDINEILYSDRPDELKQIRIKNNINPYRGYSEANIRFIISQGNTTMYQRTLWENMESIFQDLEAENDNPWLYDLNEALIREKVRVKTEEYMGIIGKQKEEEAKLYMEEQTALNQPTE